MKNMILCHSFFKNYFMSLKANIEIKTFLNENLFECSARFSSQSNLSGSIICAYIEHHCKWDSIFLRIITKFCLCRKSENLKTKMAFTGTYKLQKTEFYNEYLKALSKYVNWYNFYDHNRWRSKLILQMMLLQV